MAQAGRIYDFVPGSQDAEGEEDGSGDAQRRGYGSHDGTGSNLCLSAPSLA